MSRAFVKEPEGGQDRPELPERPISPHPNFVTSEGLDLIDAVIARLRDEHVAAQAAEDRAALARIGRDLRYWIARRASAQLLAAPADAAEVHFGSKVTLSRDDGREVTYRVVGEDEAEPARGTISYVSPLARALLGKRCGESVRAGNFDFEIVKIS